MPVTSSWKNPNLAAAITAGLKDGAEHILAESLKLVPLEEATLARSGKAEAAGTEAVVSYDTVYAPRQHEELDWQHAEGRQAKYLEQPVTTEADKVLGLIADQIGKAFT
ncbi:hypothetical protein [Timonella senegalensis]|uniref:hypothetical protein n=1 Tax=Timonella senegalensis TaxID=1465825 RepID=UPI002FDECC72